MEIDERTSFIEISGRTIRTSGMIGGLGKLDLEANPRKIATRRLKCAVKHKQEGNRANGVGCFTLENLKEAGKGNPANKKLRSVLELIRLAAA